MGKTILVADDSRTMQEAVRLVLEPEGHRLVPAKSGAEALQRARESRPALVLADAQMPEGDGAWLCAQIRADASLRSVPIVLMHRASDSFDDEARVRVGADATLGKPFASGELVDILDRLTRRPEQPAAEPRGSIAERISRMEDALHKRTPAPRADSADAVRAATQPQTSPEIPKAPPWAAPRLPGPALAAPARPSEPTRAAEPARPAARPEPSTPSGPVTAPSPAPAEVRPLTREDLLDLVRQVAREAVEKAVWEIVPDLAEKMLWDILPDLSEALSAEAMEKRQPRS